MFDIGFLELMFIGVVGLLVLGPERLPRAARTAGLWIGKIKRTATGMQREISAQLEAEDLRQKLNEQQKKLDESVRQVQSDVERLAEPDRPADSPREHSQERPPAPGPEQRLDDALSRARRDGSGSAGSDSDPRPDERPVPSTADKDAPSR